jgi:hypothetical protein
MGIGSLNNINSHANFGIKIPENGYFESGFRLNNLINTNFTGLGIGLFYRYGTYAHQKIEDNFYARMTLGISF